MAVTASLAAELEKDLAVLPTLGKAALVSIDFASTIIPAAWPIASLVYQYQCDPGQIIRTGVTWLEMVGTLNGAQTTMRTDVASVDGDGWSGRDRDAFDEQVDRYALQLSADEVVAAVVGTVLIVVGVALVIMMLALLAASVILASFALAIWLLVDDPLTAAAAPEIEAMATEFAVEAAEALETMDKAVKGVANGGGGLITSALVCNAAGQLGTGNTATLHNLVQTVVYGSLDTAAGMVAKDEQDTLADGVKAGSAPAAVLAARDTATGEISDTSGERVVGKDAWDHGGSAWNGVIP